MKKIKIFLCLALVFAMIASTCMVSFAASVSHVSYNETTVEGVTTVESSVFVAGQSKDVKLYTAVYDAEGNFVKATASEPAKTGLLETSVAKEAGQTVKSFVWDADHTPAYKPAEAEELTADDINNINITINGKPVSDFGIEELEFGGEYDIDYYKYSLDAIPYVKATTDEATLTTSVLVDEENMKTVVTIAKGANGKETVNKTVGTTGNYDVQRYTRASATITFNWIKTYIADEDFSRATTSSTTNGWIYEVPTELTFRTNKSVTLAEGETVKKVSVKFASYTTQQVIVVVKPASTAAASYIADPKSIVVASDGSALSWTNDTNVIADYYSDSSKGYSVGNIRAYGQKTTANSASVAGNAVPVYYPVKAVMSNDNGYETGSRTTTQRTPNTHQRQVYDLAKHTDLLGCAYIVGPASSYTNAEVTFYVAEDVEISTLSPSTTVTYSVADGDYGAPDSTSTDKCKIIYTNNASASDVAWLIKKGYLYPSDITSTGTNPNKKHVLNDGTTVAPVSYTLRTWDYVTNTKRVPSKLVPYNGYALVPEWSKQKNYTYQEILDLWKDHEFDTSEVSLIQDYKAATKFEGVATFRYPEKLVDYNNDKYADIRQLHEDYAYSVDVNSGRRAVLNAPGTFPGKTCYIDREGEANADGTGVIINYPEALGLEDDYNILPGLNFINGARFGAMGITNSGNIAKLADSDVWYQVAGAEWASFTVARDAKVTVLSDTATTDFTNDKEGWSYVDLGTTDCIETLVTISNNAKRNFRHAYTKFYPAGSKVTFTTPGSGALYIPFIGEWESGLEHSTELSGITVDGVALDGFDADTTEYTYTVAINDMSAPVISATAVDSAAKVKVVNPTEFPGSAKIKVTNCGEEKVYTINYVVDASATYASNLVMCPDVTFGNIKATLEKNLQIGDKTYNDRLSNANMVFSAVDPEYVGREWMRGCLGWPNDSETNDYKVKWIQAEIIPNWVSFDINRNATIHLVSTQTYGNAKGQYMLNNGWNCETDANGYLVGYTAAVTKYQYRYTKHFEVDPETGKATVQLPNIGGTSMFAVIIPDGWTE